MHEGRSNNYVFVHKDVSHVLKLMKNTYIKAKIFPALVKKKKPPKNSPKPRMALLQEGENDVAIPAMTSHWIREGGGRVLEIGCSKSSGNTSKPRQLFSKAERMI
jgi:hypothetical protein